MTQKKYALFIVIAMTVFAASLSGCGSTGLSTASTEQSQAAKANVSISAKFPSSGEAAKSLIPTGTQVIEVYASQRDSQIPSELIATLTTTAPTTTVKMVPGMYVISAIAYDSTDTATRTMLGETSTGGEIVFGVINNVNLTFLSGQWTLVNANDTASPLVLSDGTQLIDFILGGDDIYSVAAAKAGKSSIDPAKPVGGGLGMVRLRFNNNTSARTLGSTMSQFVGNANSSQLQVFDYNLTTKCDFSNFYGIPCDDAAAGDQTVGISNKDIQVDTILSGSTIVGFAYSLLPNGGRTTFAQNGTAVDLNAALPDTVVSGGSIITGGIVEWKPATGRITTVGTPGVAKVAKSALAIKAQSTNTAYANLTVKDVGPIVCSGTNPQNRGTWTFANNTSAGKVVIGSRVCYTNSPYLDSQYDPQNYQYTVNAGDYSYGLVPTDTGNLGDYCHVWDYQNNTCLKQSPGPGEIYNMMNFQAAKSATKTAINYGSFKFNFWGETAQTGTMYIYPFRAKGSTTVKAAPAAPVITSISVPATVPTGTGSATTLTASAFDPNGDSITWSWSIVSGGGALGTGCSGSGTGPITSSCAYTPPATAASVEVKFTASDGVKTSTLNRSLSVSDGTSVVIQ